ncbi:MAG: LamG-like jellyroll fold domain-containing protein [Bacteroidota bacterium]
MATRPIEIHSIHSQHGDHSQSAVGYSFNGKDEYIQLPSHWGGCNELCIEAWFKSNGSTGDFQAILSSNDLSFIHFQMHDAGTISCYTNTGVVSLPVIPPVDSKIWRHAAAIIKSGESKLIIDGKKVGSTNDKEFDFILPSDDVCIGRGFNHGRYFKGEIGDVRISYFARKHEHIHGDIFQFFHPDNKPKMHDEADHTGVFGFKSHHGKYMSAQPDGTIECNRDWLRGWEKFTVEETADGKFGLKSHHRKYLSAQPDGTLQCNRSWLRGWEKFTIEQTSDGKIGLKGAHGKYVSAQPDGTIVCDRTWLRGWEKFTQEKA